MDSKEIPYLRQYVCNSFIPTIVVLKFCIELVIAGLVRDLPDVHTGWGLNTDNTTSNLLYFLYTSHTCCTLYIDFVSNIMANNWSHISQVINCVTNSRQ